MIVERIELSDAQLESPLGRTSPIVKLAVALGWLVGLAFTLSPWPPLVLTVVAVATGLTLGALGPVLFLRTILPLWVAALGIAFFNLLFSVDNRDPTATDLLMLGPFRITVEAVGPAVALGLRVVAIAAVGVVFTLTTDSTRLADALVQQGRLSPRFAYGALAAYQAIPRFVEDLTTLRQARRIRGLGGSWHPRLLIGVLILAIRHGDRMALSMDARAFGSGPRTWYRVIRWSWRDPAVAIGAVVVLWLALSLAGTAAT